MNRNEIMNSSWKEVLKNKGIDTGISNSLIGFVSWNKDEDVDGLGEDITDILSDYRGKVYVKDAKSSKYNDKGLLFLSENVSENSVSRIFDTIMEYEQEEVFGTKQV